MKTYGILLSLFCAIQAQAASPEELARNFVGRYEAGPGCEALTALTLRLEEGRYLRPEAEPSERNDGYFDQEIDAQALNQGQDCQDGFGGGFRDQCTSQITRNRITKKNRTCFLFCDSWRTRFEVRHMRGNQFQVTYRYQSCQMTKVE